MPPTPATTTHWIITNRSVSDNGVVDENVHEPLPTFRIAKFETPTGKSPTDSQLAAAVAFTQDQYIEDYTDLRLNPSIDPDTLPGTKQLFLALYADMLASPKGEGDTLFFLHGFNFSWSDCLRHLHTLHQLYVEPASSPISRIVYFSWPSFASLFRYKSDQEIAQPCGALLGRFFSKVVRFYADFFTSAGPAAAGMLGSPAAAAAGASAGGAGGLTPRPKFCGRKVHLAAHSMGNQVLQEFIRSVRDYAHLRVPIFGQAVMLNADIGWSCLEETQPLYTLPEFCERLTVYNHNSDDALLVSESTKNNEKRLGRHGPRDRRVIASRTAVVDCSDLGNAPKKTAMDTRMADRAEASIAELQVSSRERLFDHWGYLSRKEVILDLHRVLRGTSQADMKPFREQRGDNIFRLLS